MKDGDTAKSLVETTSVPLPSRVNRVFLKNLLFFLVIVSLFFLATFLYRLEITSIAGGYFFAFALLGLRWPSQLLSVFVFLVAFKHREFTYIFVDTGSVPVYITEWVLFILTLASLPKIKRTVRVYTAPTVLIGAYFIIGLILLFLTLPYWGLLASLRDFAIIYYAVFALMVCAHIQKAKELKHLATALVLGIIPNIIAETANFLYNTLPMTSLQKNYSMRNSFYYLIALGLLLPFIGRGERKISILPFVYWLVVALVILLYSYSKTSMIALVVSSALYFLINIRRLPKLVIAIVIAMFIAPLFITPPQKVFKFKTVFSTDTYSKDTRLLVDIGSLRDFTEYPYGIGFGAPIFGENAKTMVTNVGNLYSIHNSYLALMRRVGIEGMAIFFLILITALRPVIKACYRTDGEILEKKIAFGVFLAWLSASIFSFGHVALEGPFFGSIYWILVGCLYTTQKIILEKNNNYHRLRTH